MSIAIGWELKPIELHTNEYKRFKNMGVKILTLSTKEYPEIMKGDRISVVEKRTGDLKGETLPCEVAGMPVPSDDGLTYQVHLETI